MDYKNLNVNLLAIPKTRVATGLYTHWDSVVRIDPNIMNWIDKARKEKPKGTVLESLEETAYTLGKAVKGEGREFLISEKVYESLKGILRKREMRIGGNGFNMGNMLFLSGLVPVVSYPSRSKRLMDSSPEVDVVIDNGLAKPKDTIRLLDPDYEHVTIEFDNSRHILSWDPIAAEGMFDYDFLDFATSIKNMDLLILAYAHMLLPELKSKTEDIIERLDDDFRPKVHLEFGLGSEESMKYAMSRFSENKYSESWGMNEEECMVYLKAASGKIEDMKEAAVNAIKEYNVNRICVHSREFAFAVSKYDMTKEYRALVTACLYSAARTFGDLKLEQAKRLPTTFEQKKEKIGNYNFCLVPCLINKFPQILTGIGDGFAAIQAVKVLG